jgi:hypothetical protein
MKKRKNRIAWYILGCIMITTPISLIAQDDRDPGSGFAAYLITFDSNWSQETHPHPSGNLPSVAHWSDLVGVTHNDQVTFLTMGEQASTGIQNIAELGNSTVFFQEVEQAIGENNAHNALDFGDLDTALGQFTGEFEANPDFPFLTLASMIAPSPDWMIAANSIDLQDENGSWKQEIIIDLFPYDAGTDSGIDYTSDNQITSPAGVITSLQGITPFSTQKMGTLTITLNGVLGVQEQEVNHRLSIFPNPSEGMITVSTNNNREVQQLTIYNTLGQLVKKVSMTSDSYIIDLTHLHSGIYFVRSSTSEGLQSTQKLILK